MYTTTTLDTSVKSKSTGAAVADLVREGILCGEFAEGERLPESDLARRYGVSRIPLREALQILTGEGLVKASANRGVRVRALLPKEIDEIFCIRRLVEGDLVSEAAGRLTSQNIGEAVVAAELLEPRERYGGMPSFTASFLIYYTSRLGARSNTRLRET